MLHKPGEFMRKALQDQNMTSILSTILEGMGRFVEFYCSFMLL